MQSSGRAFKEIATRDDGFLHSHVKRMLANDVVWIGSIWGCARGTAVELAASYDQLSLAMTMNAYMTSARVKNRTSVRKTLTLPLRLSVRFCMKQTVSNRMHHDS